MQHKRSKERMISPNIKNAAISLRKIKLKISLN